LERAEKGIETVLVRRRLKLSGGEKQRIAIARGTFKKPHLLIFDEATSALDSITEKKLPLPLKTFQKKEQITVLIAHRLSTIMHTDKIYVLNAEGCRNRLSMITLSQKRALLCHVETADRRKENAQSSKA
jgi:ABC-type transport system involved in Fe-S cluster assembly fused permease/ATPase subunit